jgi:hypothetical protein
LTTLSPSESRLSVHSVPTSELKISEQPSFTFPSES